MTSYPISKSSEFEVETTRYFFILTGESFSPNSVNRFRLGGEKQTPRTVLVFSCSWNSKYFPFFIGDML
jgi:hypothetical protein